MEHREDVHEETMVLLIVLWSGAKIEEGGIEEQFNKEAKDGWRFSADAARITDENAGTEDRKHTSGGVSCYGRQQLGSSCGSGRRSV